MDRMSLPKWFLVLIVSFITITSLTIILNRRPKNSTRPNLAAIIELDDVAVYHPLSRRDCVVANNRMVLTMSVREQMTWGISNLYDLVWFATDPSWNASIVLPVMNGDQSRMVGIPSDNTYPLSAIYNISAWQKMYKKLNICLPLTDFEDFMKYTDRNYIRYLHIAVPTGPDYIGPIVEKCNETAVEFESFHAAIDQLNVEAIKRHLPRFESSKASCYKIHVGYNETLPEDFITSDLKGVQNFTMIFNLWTGVVDNKRFAYQYRAVVSPSKLQQIGQIKQLLPYSNDIEEMTTKYLKNLTNGNRFVGVQIRAEQMWMHHHHDKSKKDQHKSEECIRNCYNAAQIVFKKNHYGMILYFGDHIVGKIYGNLMPEGISLSHFDPSKFNAIQNNGLIGQVEQNTLSYAETLVLCGGGSFQRSIETRFKNRNPNGSVTSVCR